MAARAGPRNLITDVPGILVGQAEDQAGVTGTTVVLAQAPAVASVDVRGGEFAILEGGQSKIFAEIGLAQFGSVEILIDKVGIGNAP